MKLFKLLNKDKQKNKADSSAISTKKRTVQHGFDFDENSYEVGDKGTLAAMKGLRCNYKNITTDQAKILLLCKQENTASELMRIVNRKHKTRFKNDILNQLIDWGFFERTIPEKPKSPKQKYRLTNKFVKKRVRGE